MVRIDQHTGLEALPAIDAGVLAPSAADEAADEFIRRMRRLCYRGSGVWRRIAREAAMDHKLLQATREMAEWGKPRQAARLAREQREQAAREQAAAHYTAHLRDYVSDATRSRMPARRVGAEYRTERSIRNRAAIARAWARRVAGNPERVLARHARSLSFTLWAVMNPAYGGVCEPVEFWESRVNRDMLKARRSASKRGQIRPVGMTIDRALSIALDVLDANGGHFPKPQTLESFGIRS